MSDEMPARPLLHPSNAGRAALILLSLLASLVAGASYLAYPDPFSPLVVLAVFAATALGIAWFRKPVWALYAALFVVLLPIGLIPPTLHSNLNRSLTVIALATWLFNIISRKYRLIWSDTSLLMLSFITWGTFTLLWTSNVEVSTTILQVYIMRFILYLLLVYNEIRTKEDLNGLMHTLALSGWVIVLVSIGTLLFEGYTPGMRFNILEANENGLGIMLLVAMPGVLWQASQPVKRYRVLKRFLAFLFLVFSLGIVAMSGSRGSAISLLITLLLFWLWKSTRIWGKLALIILILASVSTSFIFATTLQRFAITRGDTMLGGREVLWQAAWSLIYSHSWFGVGIGNAPYAVMPFLSQYFSVLEHETASIHNPILTVWIETGIPGLLLYLAVLGSAAWLFARQYCRYRQTGEQYLTPYFALISCVFLGYMASWVKGGGMETDFTYFLMLGLLLVPCGLDLTTPKGKLVE